MTERQETHDHKTQSNHTDTERLKECKTTKNPHKDKKTQRDKTSTK